MLFIYARVSTLGQADDGAASLPEQLRRGRALASLRGVPSKDVVQFIDKGVSGSIPLGLRPEGKEMMASLQKGDVVVVTKLDRIFRSAIDALSMAESFKEQGIDLVSLDMGTDPITANGVSKLIFGILAMVAEFERDRIRERTEEGRRAKRARMGYMGGRAAPIGFKVVGKGREAQLEEDEGEQEMLARVKQMVKDGHRPGRIGQYLTKYFPTRSGRPWQVVQVQRVIERLEVRH